MSVTKVGIGVLIFDNSKLLLGQRRQNHGAGTWGPPGGHLEFGEHFDECAIRETKEETSIVIDKVTFVAVTNDVFKEDNKHYVSIFFRAQYPPGQIVKNREQDKIISWEWIDINFIPDNLFLPLKNLLHEKGKDFLLYLSSGI